MRRWFVATVRAGVVIAAFAAAGCAAPPGADPGADALGSAGWVDWPLPGKRGTRYTAEHDAGRPVIRAESDASASMLRRVVRVEPHRLGALRFAWRIDDLIASADLSDRDAEDSPVRIMLAFDGNHARLSPRNRMLFDLAHAVTGEQPPYATLMYVWDNKAPRESVIHAARTDRIRKIVLESGDAHRLVWRAYERRIADDFRRAFGEEPGALVGVALMTDSDNTGSRARAWYADIELIGVDGSRL
jgi:hypothetical protein